MDFIIVKLNIIRGLQMPSYKRILSLILATCFVASMSNGGVRNCISTGNWSAAATWVEGSSPSLGDTVRIFGNAAVTIDVLGASCSVLELGLAGFINGYGRVEITSAVGFLTVTNRITLGDGAYSGTIHMTDGNLSIGGSVVVNNGSFDAEGGTIAYGLFTSSNQTIVPTTYYNLTLQPGTKTAGGNLIIKGELTIRPSAIFNAGNYSHSVYGDWNNEGTFSAGNGSVRLKGISPQAILGDNTFYNLYLDAGINTAGAGITVDAEFRNYVNGTFDAGSFTHVFKGPWTNDGTFVPGTSTVRFSGSSAQTITGPTTFNNLTIGTGGTKTAVSPLTVNGAFLVLASGSFDAGSQTYTLKGDWTNNGGSFAAGTSTIILNGSAVQTISGTMRFNNFTIDNPSGVKLTTSSTDTIVGTLAFNSGRLQLGSSNLRLGNNAVVTGAAAGQCIVTNGSGKVSHRIVGGASAESFQFPVGPNSTSYNPLTITLRPNANEPTELFEVSVAEFDNSSPGFGTIDTSQCVLRVWDINEVTPGSNHANFTFQWNKDEDGAAIGVTPGSAVQLSAYRYASGSYTTLDDASGPAPGPNPIVASTLGFLATDFGSFTVGRPGLTTSVTENTGPLTFELLQNYPNPFNPTTTLSFSLPAETPVTLEIFNLIGQRVKVLLDAENAMSAGRHELQWNGRDDASRPAASGIYFYRLQAGSFVETKRMILMK